jgi:hypothetical protein
LSLLSYWYIQEIFLKLFFFLDYLNDSWTKIRTGLRGLGELPALGGNAYVLPLILRVNDRTEMVCVSLTPVDFASFFFPARFPSAIFIFASFSHLLIPILAVPFLWTLFVSLAYTYCIGCDCNCIQHTHRLQLAIRHHELSPWYIPSVLSIDNETNAVQLAQMLFQGVHASDGVVEQIQSMLDGTSGTLIHEG